MVTADERFMSGVALAARGALDAAVAAFEAALTLRPEEPEYHLALAHALFDLGRYGAAFDQYRQALARTSPDDPDRYKLYANLGACEELEGRIDDAVASYQAAIALNPACVQAHANLRDLHRRAGRDAAALVHDDVLGRIDTGPALRLRAALDLPAILPSLEAIAAIRARLGDDLERIAADGSGPIGHPETEINATALYLAYHGRNDVALMRQLADAVRGVYPAADRGARQASDAADQAHGHPGQRIRIGFVSTFFCNHSIGRHNRGLIAALCREKFEVHVFFIATPDDETSRLIRQLADRHYDLPNHVRAIAASIRDAGLDVLYFPEIGLHPTPYFLSFWRLAPVQCVSYGHPVTTGVDTIDYFLSSQDMEQPEAQAHYSEQLVRLEGFFMPAYAKPLFEGPPAGKAEFGALPSQRIYFCAQTAFKLHPEFDIALALILRGDPHGILVLFEGAVAGWTTALQLRFRQTLPDVFDRIRFIPQRSTSAYFGLLRGADVVLDTFHFGGGISAMDAFAAGVPVATLEGEFFRGRQAAACYAAIEMADCICRNPAQYVEFALRVARDRAFRCDVTTRIEARNARLFDRMDAVRALERFLQTAVARAGHRASGKPPRAARAESD